MARPATGGMSYRICQKGTHYVTNTQTKLAANLAGPMGLPGMPLPRLETIRRGEGRCKMKCHVCSKDRDSGFLTPLGFACKECGDASSKEWKEICDRELALPLDDGPDNYDLSEFERFALRLAVKLLDNKPFAKQLRDANPIMCCPDQFSLWIKEQLIRAAPQYFSTWEARGHSRIFHGGEFRLIGTIPKSEAVSLAAKAGILSEGCDP